MRDLVAFTRTTFLNVWLLEDLPERGGLFNGFPGQFLQLRKPKCYFGLESLDYTPKLSQSIWNVSGDEYPRFKQNLMTIHHECDSHTIYQVYQDGHIADCMSPMENVSG